MQKIKIVLLITLTFAVSVISLGLISEWRPRDIERVEYSCASVTLPDTLTLVSWNIGYAGLGEDMDFFYDGGVRTRCSEQRTRENLDAIISTLDSLSDADFILLQEVDISSKRSYYIDLASEISRSLPTFPYTAFALNYSSVYVPIPLREPMGRVQGGLMILSKHPISSSLRRQYPSLPSLPTRLFDLKRCMLSVEIKCESGEALWINNTHNSAFADAERRISELEYIAKVVDSLPCSLTAGDWNSTPVGYVPSREAVENRYFSPLALPRSLFGEGVEVSYGQGVESVRYLDAPYVEGQSVTTLVDFAVLGKKCGVLDNKILDLGFLNSDHNPFVVTFLYHKN